MSKTIKLCLLIGIPVVILAVAALVLFLPGGLLNSNEEIVNPERPTITLAQYNNVNRGMTYEEVKEVFKSDGLVFQGEQGEEPESAEEAYMVIYVWFGKLDGSTATLTFVGGNLSHKTHVGLT